MKCSSSYDHHHQLHHHYHLLSSLLLCLTLLSSSLISLFCRASNVNYHAIMTDNEKILFFGSIYNIPPYQVISYDKITGYSRNHLLSKRSILQHSLRTIKKTKFNNNYGENNFNNKTYNIIKSAKISNNYSLDEFNNSSNKFNNNLFFPNNLNISFNVFNQQFKLNLHQNNNLLSNNFWVSEYFDSRMASCFYQGSLLTHPHSSVAISLCDGIKGIIETSEDIYVINSLPQHISNRSDDEHLHIIIKPENLQNYTCPHHSSFLHKTSLSSFFHNYSSLMTNKISRYKRSSLPKSLSINIETALFIDSSLHKSLSLIYPKDTTSHILTYVLTIMNGVQLIYKQNNLGVNVNISVVTIDILKEDEGLSPSSNIDTYLTNFCVWQKNRKLNARGVKIDWDHALLLSGVNMYVVDSSGRRRHHVVGLAPVGGMCNSLNSCTISEGTSFQTVLVAAHEMGHSLGMEHDGVMDGNECSEDDFLMSPTLGSGKTSWSTCSSEYLVKFISTPQAKCVLSPSNHVNILQQYSPPLPGQIFNADAQCEFRFGKGSRKSTIQGDICSLLRCDTGSNLNVVAYHAHPALEGTSCAPNKWCREGKCIEMKTLDTSESQIVISKSAKPKVNPDSIKVDEEGSNLCYVWSKDNTKINLPNGAICGQSNTVKKICIQGECRSIQCDHQSSQICSRLLVEHYVGLNSKDHSKWLSWNSISKCRYPCLVNGKGIKLIQRKSNSLICNEKEESYQLCDTSENSCKRSIKTAEQYAHLVCSKYKVKYPTLLSGRGRQLAPRTENADASCIIACEDRVWKDIHYQMDAFKDGKFPLGTSCALGTNKGLKAYCVDGKCIRFNNNNMPLNKDAKLLEKVKQFFKHEAHLNAYFYKQKKFH